MEFVNLYNLLQIPTGASSQEIKKAYRKLAKVWHPDHNYGSKKAEDRFKEILWAYETLSDPLKRKAYDREWAEYLKKAAEPKKESNSDFTWKSADTYQSDLEALWRRYQNLHPHSQKNTRPTPSGEKYYYYNHQRFTQAEFRAYTAEVENERTKGKTKKKKKEVHIYAMDPSDQYLLEQSSHTDSLLFPLAALFAGILVLIISPSLRPFSIPIGILFVGLGFLIGTSLRTLRERKSLRNLIIEIHPDRIIRKGKGFQETTIHFHELAHVNEISQGIFISRNGFYPDEKSYTHRLVTSDDDIIFIPSAIHNFEVLRQFLHQL